MLASSRLAAQPLLALRSSARRLLHSSNASQTTTTSAAAAAAAAVTPSAHAQLDSGDAIAKAWLARVADGSFAQSSSAASTLEEDPVVQAVLDNTYAPARDQHAEATSETAGFEPLTNTTLSRLRPHPHVKYPSTLYGSVRPRADNETLRQAFFKPRVDALMKTRQAQEEAKGTAASYTYNSRVEALREQAAMHVKFVSGRKRQAPPPLTSTMDLMHTIGSDPILQKLVNCLMESGKKRAAQKILIDTMIFLKMHFVGTIVPMTRPLMSATEAQAARRAIYEQAASAAAASASAAASDASASQSSSAQANALDLFSFDGLLPSTTTTTTADSVSQPTLSVSSDLEGDQPSAEVVAGAEFVSDFKTPLEFFSVLDMLHEAIDNVRPLIELKSTKVAASTYQVPFPIQPARQVSLALKWIIDAARKRATHGLAPALALEIFDAYNRRGTTMKKRMDMHRMAEANRAYAHFRLMKRK
ncbi:30S ribosomal subunit protein S7 [Capsaspora owczarzaki ATCC 30864]|uniref:30S ribosomal subunit protein S7 n=1 Tax=Capsaspora owczarzaki (strain ATCC 30864) TaxID=595528 RepID=A0A0D2X048_CAPO3|nr:30S ribosomal subunit protein S7 [Capsaspora owczarzaki ATCC 30864]KJE88434.1 30S ribosomal subunit protein S7 [Capsaspora owczarzaki ATCC 30864]|eukprot:XP_004364963.1 30S ribosomal subunit protein S7 [Capsaspora owczarzaki ATCC 30864]